MTPETVRFGAEYATCWVEADLPIPQTEPVEGSVVGS